jgi:hypothetical protein
MRVCRWRPDGDVERKNLGATHGANNDNDEADCGSFIVISAMAPIVEAQQGVEKAAVGTLVACKLHPVATQSDR